MKGILGAADIINEEITTQSYPETLKKSNQEFYEITKVSSLYLIEVIERMTRLSKVREKLYIF